MSRFKVEQVSGSLDEVDCVEPNSARWEWMEPVQVSLTGRGVQQGRLRVTLSWEIMSDGDFGNLMDMWKASRGVGYRVNQIAVPTFNGDDNSIYPTFAGATSPGGYIRVNMPQGEREVFYVKNVTLVFEDIMEDD